MGRSQRHKTLVENYPSDCKWGAQGVAAPGYRLQGAGPYVVPMGPAGGPLQGSSLAGPAPGGPIPLLDSTGLGADDGSMGVQSMSMETGGGENPDPLAPPAQTGETPAPAGRTFPMGPFNLVQVRYDDTLGQMIFRLEDAASGMLRDGDTVVISATGLTPANGTYTAANVAGPEFGVVMDNVLTGAIDNKGRASIIAGEP